MKRFSILFIACLLVQGLFAQQTLTIAAPEKAHFSPEKLHRIDELVQQYIDSNWIAGAVSLVARDGQVIYYKAQGYNEKDKGTLLKKDDIFRIASQTKAVTSVAVMMLVEQGKISLDDPISKYIPGFAHPRVIDQYNATDTTYTTVPANREPTIHDLLTHTSGISYAQIGTKMMNAVYYKAGVVGGIGLPEGTRLSDNIQRLSQVPLSFQPGAKWSYGLNTDVLGYVVEVVSGMSLDAFFREKIFRPLGMNDTYFYLPPSKRDRLMMLYSYDTQRKLVQAPTVLNVNGDFIRDYPLSNTTFYSGGGGLSSTAYDYAIFMQMLLNEGVYNGHRLLKPETVHLMTSNQIGELFNGNNKFGLGFQIVTETNKAGTPESQASFGWGGMFSSSYWIDPVKKIVAQFVLQIYPNPHADILNKFTKLVYEAMDDR